MDQSDRKHLMQREILSESDIPYTGHLTPEVVLTNAGDFVTVIQLEGIAFQTADIGDVNIAHETLNIILRNVASAHVTFWTHTIRDEEKTYVDGDFQTTFARSLNAKYKSVLTGNNLMANTMYITVVYRPVLESADRAIHKFKKTMSSALREAQAEAHEKLADVVKLIQRMLGRYGPRQLKTYYHNNIMFSEPLELFGFLVNGFWQRMPVQMASINSYLATSRPFWGTETYLLRGVSREIHGAMLAFKTYPANAFPGILNEFLTQPISFTLTQSFQFVDRMTATDKLKLELRRMDSTGELIEQQISDVADKLEQLNNGEIVFGTHHLSLNVYAKSSKALKASLSVAMSTLGNTGCVVAQEDDAIVDAFWSQLPGKFKERPRLALLDSRSFAAFSPFHNYPAGQKHGNQWGDAVIMLRTPAGTPYYFNFHHSKAEQQKLIRNAVEIDIPSVDTSDEIERRKSMTATYSELAATEVATLSAADIPTEYIDLSDLDGNIPPFQEKKIKEMIASLGNTIILGPAGSGKTVMQATLITFLIKYCGMRIVVFDKDCGLELTVRANGGTYLRLKEGVKTGMAPFQITKTISNKSFLVRLVKKICCPNGEALTTTEEEDISRAVHEVMEMDIHMRQLRRVYDLISSDDPKGAKSRLKKWVHGGELAWVFDNENDAITLDTQIAGIDLTEFLDIQEIRSPINMYLAHRIRSDMVRGNPFVWDWDEMWKGLDDPELSYIAKDELKTIRKKNGLLLMGTQEPEDVIKGPIASTIISQTSTMILCPNPKADRKVYVDGLKLTDTEFQIVKTGMPPGSNRYLIKQGHSSVVVELNLGDKIFADELSILSGTKANIAILDEIIKEVGTDDPDVWLPIFYKRRS